MIIQKYSGNLDELVFSIGNLHYDLTAKVLHKIADNIGKKAYENNSSRYRDISNCVYESKLYMDIAWIKCKDKMDCSKHPRTIPKYTGTIDELALDIADSSEKEIVIFLEKLGDDLLRQANADWKERKQLATQLYFAANSLYKIKMEL